MSLFSQGDAEEVPIEQDEVDPSVIRSTRTRGAKVDYSSEEALKKAGYSNEAGASNEDDEEEEDAEFKVSVRRRGITIFGSKGWE